MSVSYVYPVWPALPVLRALERGAQIAMCLLWPLAAMLSSKDRRAAADTTGQAGRGGKLQILRTAAGSCR